VEKSEISAETLRILTGCKE